MSTRSNPFRPTFGVPPLYWVGRTAVLDAFRNALQSPAGASARTIIISGARGIGKTVLLNELEDSAKAQGWMCIRASGRTNMVEELVETTIPRLIEQLAPRDKRKINRIGIGGVGSIGVEHNTDEPYKHMLNTRLRDLLAQLSGVGILLSIDEVQDASVEDLTSIAVAYQDLLRDELDISFVAAGLPQGVNRLLDLPGVTFYAAPKDSFWVRFLQATPPKPLLPQQLTQASISHRRPSARPSSYRRATHTSFS